MVSADPSALTSRGPGNVGVEFRRGRTDILVMFTNDRAALNGNDDAYTTGHYTPLLSDYMLLRLSAYFGELRGNREAVTSDVGLPGCSYNNLRFSEHSKCA